jgi:hypothetical protein
LIGVNLSTLAKRIPRFRYVNPHIEIVFPHQLRQEVVKPLFYL